MVKRSSLLDAAIAGVADEGLVAFLELPFERGQDRGAVGGILFRLAVITADDVAASGQRHRLGLVIDTLAALADGQRARTARDRRARGRGPVCRSARAHREYRTARVLPVPRSSPH